jgi:hypothetical protein
VKAAVASKAAAACLTKRWQAEPRFFTQIDVRVGRVVNWNASDEEGGTSR